MGRPVPLRQPGIDALKGLACVLIIWHHLAFYGPMSDVLYPHAPTLTDWLYDYGRMAVQVFLVIGGFLAAKSLAPQGQATYASPGRLMARRYRRLVLPYLVAVAASVAVAALVRPWFDHASLPSAPTLFQVLAHGLLLQDMLEFEGLSAGVWYVAIDFQLFAMAVLLFSLSRRLERRWPGLLNWRVAPGRVLTVMVCAASLFLFNNDSRWDTAGIYFFGAYGLGMLAFWAGNSDRRAQWLLCIGLLAGSALLLDFRGRLLVALVVAFGLVFLQRIASGPGTPRWPQRQLAGVGQMSYSIFLIHFPVCLGVNAVVSWFWPAHLLANAAGLLAAFALSVGAGRVLYRNVESRASLYSFRFKLRFAA